MRIASVLFFAFLFLGVATVDVSFAAISLSKGVNLSDWLNQEQAYHHQTTRYQKSDFEDIKSLGCDHVRIFVNFGTEVNRAPDYEISPIQYGVLDNAIRWAEELGLKVIIVNDDADIADATVEPVTTRLVATWKNVATKYAGKGDVLAYELYAHPDDVISVENWNNVVAAIIAGIREVDTNHTIIVGPRLHYSVDELANLTKFADDNVLYAFEFFEPLLFTHQGNDFRDVDYNTNVVPFPYDAGKMPPMSADDAGTDAETAYNNYTTQGNVDWVKSKIDVAAQFAANNSVPVWCAGFGSYIGTNGAEGVATGWRIPDADRSLWLQTVREELESKGIGWCHSDYRGSFGIFENYNYDPDIWLANSVFPYDVIRTTLTALGLTIPDPIGYYVPEPLTEGFTIYDDEVTPLARFGQWFGDDHSLFDEDEPVSGKYCFAIFYPGQWQAGDFFFPLWLDMSELVAEGYLLDFFIRCDWETAHIEARFEDTNDDLEDRPWRMNKHIDNNTVPFDGEWQRVLLPLAEMDDQGAWDPDDRTWYNGGSGLQDWSLVQRLQFVSETEAQPDAVIYIDRVRIVHPDAVEGKSDEKPDIFKLASNFPNPFNPTTNIQFTLAEKSDIELAIFNIRGEKIKVLVTGETSAGNFLVSWDGTDNNGSQMPSGIYLYQLKTNQQQVVKQMVLVR